MCVFLVKLLCVLHITIMFHMQPGNPYNCPWKLWIWTFPSACRWKLVNNSETLHNMSEVWKKILSNSCFYVPVYGPAASQSIHTSQSQERVRGWNAPSKKKCVCVGGGGACWGISPWSRSKQSTYLWIRFLQVGREGQQLQQTISWFKKWKVQRERFGQNLTSFWSLLSAKGSSSWT